MVTATTEEAFRAAAADFFAHREDSTLPAQGWPWPWNTSDTTDCSYAFDGERVWQELGGRWHDATVNPTDEMFEDMTAPACVFPDMSSLKNVTLGPRSGVMVFGAR